jgi:uncharacterized protein (TIGR03118 family)
LDAKASRIKAMPDLVHAYRTGARARLHPVVFPALLLLAACGGGGGYGGGGGGGGGMAPTVTLTASASSITLGQSSTLTWSSTGATVCNESGAWSTSNVGASGNSSVTPTAVGSATYTMTCIGAYGSTPQSVTLTVTSGAGPYAMTALVADTKGTAAQTTDANLVNPWGLSMAPGDPVWTANNGSQTSTLYDGAGKAQPLGSPLVVKLAAGFAPTGIVANSSGGFMVSSGAKSAAALFIYAGANGMLAGWAPTVDPINAITSFTDAGGAVYKGLAFADKGGTSFLYAADFHNNKIDVFNSSWVKQVPTPASFSFTDSTLPKGYAPFGIQAINNGTGGATQIYVAYAMQTAPANDVSTAGAGLGIVDVFDTNGTLITHLIPAGGKLNSPWGIALAPKDFGALSNDLLVGNFGDGTINAYDSTGKWKAALSDSKNNPVTIPGLWGIVFGNDAAGQPHNTLFFAAGPNNQANGVYGRLDAGSTPPVLNKAPVVAITAPPPYSSGGGYGGGGGTTLKGTVAVTATASSSVGITSVQFFENGNAIGNPVLSPPYTVQWDTTKDANGSITLTAKATDADGNVGTSPADVVDVSNAAGGGAVTLTTLYTNYFGPICSHCHTGVGSSLPGVQNFSSKSATYTATVNVASIEEPSLKRIKPNDPANSYLIQKLQGTQASGARMPFGGPYLTTTQINDFISWVNSGAPNN